MPYKPSLMPCKPPPIKMQPKKMSCMPSLMPCKPSEMAYKPFLIDCKPSLKPCKHPVIELQPHEIKMQHPEIKMQPPEIELQHPEIEMQPPEIEMQHPEIEMQPFQTHCKPSKLKCRLWRIEGSRFRFSSGQPNCPAGPPICLAKVICVQLTSCLNQAAPHSSFPSNAACLTTIPAFTFCCSQKRSSLCNSVLPLCISV